MRFTNNNRTGLQAALVFMEGHGIDTAGLPEQAAYDGMIGIATHRMGRTELAGYFRAMLG